MDDKPSSRSSFPRYIQDVLSFEGWKEYPQFATRHVSSFFNDRFSSFELLHLFLMIRQSHSLSVTSALSCLICTQTQGLGRNVLLGSILSSCLGGHVFAALALSLDKLAILQQHDLTMLLGQARMDLIWQWCVYVVAICTFHLLEFSVTAVYNPTEASSDSFLVNHSQSYTIAVVSSSAEFWVRFLFFPSLNAPQYIVALALALVICSQIIRSVAMATAGASFIAHRAWCGVDRRSSTSPTGNNNCCGRQQEGRATSHTIIIGVKENESTNMLTIWPTQQQTAWVCM